MLEQVTVGIQVGSTSSQPVGPATTENPVSVAAAAAAAAASIGSSANGNELASWML